MSLPAALGHVATLLGAELLRLVRGIAWLVGGGLISAARRRELSYRAIASLTGLAALLALGVVALPVWGGRAPGPHLFVLAIALMGVVLGLVAAWATRKLALWELYASIAIIWGALGVGLGPAGLGLWRWGVARLGRRGFELLPDAWTQPLGAQLFGPLNEQLLVAFGPAVLLLALWACSCLLLVVGLEPGGAIARERGFALEWRLARRHIAGTRGRGLSLSALVTIVGVALGVAALVVVTAVMSGYQADIRDKILGTNAHLVVQKYGLDFTEVDAVYAAAQQVPGVQAAAPFVFNEVMLQAKRRGTGVLLKGIDPARAALATNVARTLEGETSLGELLADAGDHASPPILVGAALASRMDLHVGDEVALMTPVAMAGVRGNAPVRKTFVVRGVFRAGLYEFDNHLIYTPLSAAQALLGMGQAVSGVELRLAAPEEVGDVSHAMLGHLGRYPYRTLDWRQLNASIFTALTLQKLAMALVLLFIVVVASFNIASTLFMAVVERAPHVAVLKSMGATDATIMKIFVLEGLATGWLGTALGLVLGLGGAWGLGHLRLNLAADVYMVEALTVRIEPREILLVMVAASGICHLATLYPALRAARAQPAAVLRGLAVPTHKA